MNFINLGGKEYPVFFGGAAIMRLWQDIDSSTLAQITAKISALSQEKKDGEEYPQVTDAELFKVFVPVVKWGIWGGARFEGQNVSPMDSDDIADLLYPDNMGEGFKALLYFFESMPSQQNGEQVEKEAIKKN